MSRLTILPHRTASDVAWSLEAWRIIRADGSEEPVGPLFRGWDYDQSITVRSRVRVHGKKLAAACGLGPDSVFRFLAIWDCPATARREIGYAAEINGDVDGTDLDVLVKIGPHSLAEEVHLYRQVVLVEPGDSTAPFSPAYEGSIVLIESPESTARIRLEGDGGRFPVEAANFEELGLGDAAWNLQVAYVDPDDSFLGAVRLLVNSAHPAMSELLSGANQDCAGQVMSVMRWDATRQLLLAVESDPEFRRGSFEEGSIGDVVDRICSSMLGSTVEAILALATADRARFEMLIQDRGALLR